MENMIDKALKLAAEIHKGQVDKSGKPFILHILKVALQGVNELEIVTGLLHDIVEDSGGEVGLGDLIIDGYPAEAIEAVAALTRGPKELYRDYLARCVLNPLAARVKLYDLLHNMDPNRDNFAGAASLRKRHMKAYEYIMKRLERIE